MKRTSRNKGKQEKLRERHWKDMGRETKKKRTVQFKKCISIYLLFHDSYFSGNSLDSSDKNTDSDMPSTKRKKNHIYYIFSIHIPIRFLMDTHANVFIIFWKSEVLRTNFTHYCYVLVKRLTIYRKSAILDCKKM